MNHDLPAEVITALERGSKIDAIKFLRESSGVGLKEAKEMVEEFIERSPDVKMRMDAANVKSAAGALRWLIPIIAIAVAVYFYLAGKH